MTLSNPYSPGIKGSSLSRDRNHLLTLRHRAWRPRKPHCLSFPHSGLVSCLPRPGQHWSEGLCLLCGHLTDPADRGCWLALLPAPVGPLHRLSGPGAHHHCSDTGASQKAGVKQALAPTLHPFEFQDPCHPVPPPLTLLYTRARVRTF